MTLLLCLLLRSGAPQVVSRLGNALDSLRSLLEDANYGPDSFDFAFIGVVHVFLL